VISVAVVWISLVSSQNQPNTRAEGYWHFGSETLSEAVLLGLAEFLAFLLQESEAPAGTRQIRSAWAARGQFAEGKTSSA
jgi:hypothetical protein